MVDFTDPNNTVLVYADDAFSAAQRKKYPLRAKTADGYLRYAQTNIVGVVDASATEHFADEIIPLEKHIPMFTSIKEYIAKEQQSPHILLIGVAPSGGEITEKVYEDIVFAISNGMHIVSGMHYELNKDTQLVKLAKEHTVTMWDVRVPPDDIHVASCLAYFVKKPILLTCASDAAIGKMTVGFELERQLAKKGIYGELLATGQTAIMVKGKGISIDRVIGDFMPGAVEKLVTEADQQNQFLIIEGQGGLCHPGYAPVTLALLHGGLPTHAILIQRPQRKHSIGSKLIKLPSVRETMQSYQTSALSIRKPEFIGIALHTAGLDEQRAKEYQKQYEDETGLPVEDMIRFPTGALASAFEKVIQNYTSV